MAENYQSKQLNTTQWDMDTTCTQPGQFLSRIQADTVYRSRQVSHNKTSATSVLESPYDITFIQPPGTKGFYLVTEPLRNHVGVYSANDMTYLGPLGLGTVLYQSPTSVISLKSGGFVLIDENKINIFDECGRPLQELCGRYHGLSEGNDDDLYTLHGLQIVRIMKENGRYIIKEKIKLTVIKDFEKWNNLTKPRNLLYSMDKVYISDSGLHKLLMVDLITGQQMALGYLGEGIGQFQRPTGMVADKVGNLLLVDQGNNRVLLYNSSGKFIRVAIIEDRDNVEQPSGITLCGGNVFVTFMGNSGKGGVVKYKLELED
jgi:DNA-binding beta-propeller fold protein YncE